MSKKVLITAGSTTVPIDKVRAITNIFKGKTGTQIAQYFEDEEYEVTLITSSPDKIEPVDSDIKVVPYKTYDQLLEVMEHEIKSGNYDIVIHSAAVSDYKVDGVYVQDADGDMVAIDKTGKVGSSHPELYLCMSQTEKIIDKIKKDWGFKGYLVKFKLEVDKTDTELLQIAHKSRRASDADLIVANCLEWASQRAFVISYANVRNVSRRDIASAIKEYYEHHIGNNG